MILRKSMTMNNVGVVYYKHSDIEKFKEQHEKFSTLEYQCHYFALNRVETFSDNSVCVQIFPLLYFNYNQEVGPVTVDFELKDIEVSIKKYEDEAMKLAQELIEEFKYLDANKSISYSITCYNNIHRHP